jgi:outer membrane protein OmpA-like peptidoglycan-associated protein
MFPIKITTCTMATALAVTLAGCASTPPSNPELSRLEAELKVAYSDKYIAQYGQADLAKAETSLTAARKDIHERESAETQHDLTMAEGYINLAEVHGNQERTKADIAALNVRQNQVRLEARDRQINRANDKTDAARADAAQANMQADNARADAAQANMQADNARADTASAEAANLTAQAETERARVATETAEQKLAAMKDKLSMYDMKITALGATLVLRDVMFATNSAQLREGAVNRLNPLIEYLKSSPTTSVRIEGHTDSVGSSAHNETLSLDRANSVAQALKSNGGVTNPIQTFGMGESKPIASNATVSGREQNRRVEITLSQ